MYLLNVVIYRVCLSPRNQHCFPVAICLSSSRKITLPGSTTSLPVLKELVLSLKMGYWILSSPNMLHWIIANTGMDPCIQEQGLCTAFTVTSLGNLEVQSPCTVRTLRKLTTGGMVLPWHQQVYQGI